MGKGQLETDRWLAVICILLLLVFTGLEATHAHSDARLSGSSSSCALCVSAHANALVVSFVPLPAPLTVDAVPAPFRLEVRGHAAELSLFIRPPPAPSA
jgi:hypothetical protein